jgi:peptidoglycan hydrolase-like protein with peptidoglycan-binding domain
MIRDLTFPLCCALLVGTALRCADAAPPNGPAVSRAALLHTVAYSRTVETIQRELGRAGYDPGPADGELTDRTRDAIRAYQRDSGLLVTGEPSAALLDHLAAAPRRESGDVSRGESGDVSPMRLQRLLDRLGYDVTASGVMDARTQAAIRAYEQDHNLLVTGEPSRALLEHMQGQLGDRGRGRAARPADDEVRISDSFEDGDFTGDPAWQVVSGEFRVENGRLHSAVEQRTDDREFGRILGDVFGEALGIAVPGPSKVAAIAQGTPFANAFRIALKLGGEPDAEARVNLGPYRGNSPSQGYRLVYDSASDQPLSVLAVDGEKSRTIASTSQVPRLADGAVHEVEWTRDPDGEMRVMVDGDLALAVGDRSIEDGFSGFSLINGGGQWRLDEVAVRARDR